jgi:hypothetical protein
MRSSIQNHALRNTRATKLAAMLGAMTRIPMTWTRRQDRRTLVLGTKDTPRAMTTSTQMWHHSLQSLGYTNLHLRASRLRIDIQITTGTAEHRSFGKEGPSSAD